MFERGMERVQQPHGQHDERALDELALRAVKPASVDVAGTSWPAASPSSSRSATWSATSRRCRRTAGAGHLPPHASGHRADRPDRCHAPQPPHGPVDHGGWRGTSPRHLGEHSRPGRWGATSSTGCSRRAPARGMDQSCLRTDLGRTVLHVTWGIPSSSASPPSSQRRTRRPKWNVFSSPKRIPQAR
jgi:hypothetical protein